MISVERVMDPQSESIESAFAFTRKPTHPGLASCIPDFWPSRGDLRRYVTNDPEHRLYVASDGGEVVGVLVMHGSHVAAIFVEEPRMGDANEAMFSAAYADHPRVRMSLPTNVADLRVSQVEHLRATDADYEWGPD